MAEKFVVLWVDEEFDRLPDGRPCGGFEAYYAETLAEAVKEAIHDSENIELKDREIIVATCESFGNDDVDLNIVWTNQPDRYLRIAQSEKLEEVLDEIDKNPQKTPQEVIQENIDSLHRENEELSGHSLTEEQETEEDINR